jgi:hypothetical protein
MQPRGRLAGTVGFRGIDMQLSLEQNVHTTRKDANEWT